MLIPLLAILASGSDQTPSATPRIVQTPTVFAPYALDAIAFRQAGLLDRLCLVEAKGRRHESRSGGSSEGGVTRSFSADVSVEDGLVLDGPEKGKTLGFVAFDPPSEPPPGVRISGGSGIPTIRRPAFVVGRRYLALAVSVQDDRLYQPDSLDDPRWLKEGNYTVPSGRDEASLLCAFPTGATALPADGNAGARLWGALVDALPACRGWDRKRLVEFLVNSRGDGFDDSGVKGDSPITERFRAVAKAASDPQVRLSAYAVLVNWRVLGSDGTLFVDLMDAADGPSLDFQLPSDPRFAIGSLDLPGDYEIPYDRPRANRLAATAKNGTIRRYLFERAVEHPTAADKRAYVGNLDREPPEFVDRVMLPRLAEWDRAPAKAPVYGERGLNAPNRQALVAYWKARYRVR